MKIRTAILASLLVSSISIVGCQDSKKSRLVRANQALPVKIQQKMAAMNMPKNSPILVRIFKEESALEVWKQKRDGKYGLIAQYDICKWSGKLGPKYVEGDRQAPEGFYTVSQAQMNPYSNYYLAFNIGFPNAYDRAHGRTGRHLMVHGSCSSSGCYSMTDKSIAQIYAFGRDSFLGGQREFQVHAFPFRMTAQNMTRYSKDPNYSFWTMLKEGYDAFETGRMLPKVDVCDGRYVFNKAGYGGICPLGGESPLLQTAYASDRTGMNVPVPAGKAPAPSIASAEEARLIADWSRRRARGEKVTRQPPSFSPASAETAGAPDIVQRINVVTKPSVTNETTASMRH